jgi:2-C-methyl-D-erythritol 4-phosphate cytidylyltransferase / 2-C-methyl-D-erythritol 2,4-cyclodiphosphate synthase
MAIVGMHETVMTGCIALVVAAGRGTRLGGPLPKQYRELAGRPVLRHSLERFIKHPGIDNVRAVIHPGDRQFYLEAAAGLNLLEPVDGGDERQESVRKGLESLIELAPDTVLIHDAARPFVDDALINRVISALDERAGAIPAVPVADTLKRGEGGLITATVDRSGLWRAQTPQGFVFDCLIEAHRKYTGERLTDDAALLELAGHGVALVDGSEENTKVTTEQDLQRAANVCAPPEFRTGNGFDVHRFTEGDIVTICGIHIAHESGLSGHSDADVGLHALTDALFGTIADGDIGSHFPPNEAQWKDADSALFLTEAVNRIAARGGQIINVDVTIICERPKIGPHRERMKARLADILGIELDRISVKATTTERLGFAGRGEGIAAQASATIRLPG